MIIFGDDGFRDKAYKGLLKKQFLRNFFFNFNYLLKKVRAKKLILGYDTRDTYKYIIKIILENIKIPKAIEIVNHPISTPGVQYLSKINNCMGIMITASHFSSKYNGFKFFFVGKKLSKSNEKYLEKKLKKKSILTFRNRPRIKKINSKLYNKFINKINIKKLNDKILIDCANGSVSGFYKKIDLFKKVDVINTEKFGNKINLNCGTNYLEKNSKKAIFKRYNYCISFDGDADRFLVFQKKYGVIETEKIALIFIKYFQSKKKINSIVGTEITNPWLSVYLKKMNIKFFRAKVGDRNVIQKKIKSKSFIGFETSGHFCFDNYMDGLQSALFFLKILNEKPKIVQEILNEKINFSRKIFEISNNKTLNKILKLTKKTKLKIIVRKSIWTKKIKIYFFINLNSYNEKENFKKLIKYKFFKKEVKN